MATMAITAPTPMMTPNMVNADRSLFTPYGPQRDADVGPDAASQALAAASSAAVAIASPVTVAVGDPVAAAWSLLARCNGAVLRGGRGDGRPCPAPGLLTFHEAVLEVNDALPVGGHLGIMGHEDDGDALLTG